jgi:hypothetical protein
MRWIAVLCVLAFSGCARDKLVVKAETKPFSQEVTISATWEVSR